MGGVKKPQLRKLFAKIFQFKNWQLFLILILMLFVSATLLRLDHIEMARLRSDVLAADAKEDADDAEIIAAINRLQEFTHRHIVIDAQEENGVEKIIFGTGRIVLANSYYRKANQVLAEAQSAADQAETNPNGNSYRQVADICDAQGKRNGWVYPDPRYISCWQDELAKFPASDELQSDITAKIPSAELYEYEFSSPYWYPCLSGFAILICIILVITIIVRIIIWGSYRLLVHFATHRK